MEDTWVMHVLSVSPLPHDDEDDDDGGFSQHSKDMQGSRSVIFFAVCLHVSPVMKS